MHSLTNLDAERVVLGALLDGCDMPEKLHPEHFAEPVHGSLFSELQRRAEADVPRHAMQVQSWWVQQPFAAELDADEPYLSGLLYEAATDQTLGGYVAQVIEYAERRALDAVGERLRMAATDTAYAPKDALEDAERDLAGFAETGSTGRKVSSVHMAFERAERNRGTGLPTGWRDMDYRFNGWRGGKMYVGCGRPGAGKSLFGGGCALSLAARGFHTAIVSLEMDEEELATRIAAALADVPYSSIERGTLTDPQRSAVHHAKGRLEALPLTILDMPGASLAAIRSALRRLDRDIQRRSGKRLSLAVVDYLGLITSPSAGMGLYEATSRNSQGIKQMARELDIPILALVQLSRAVEQRNDKHPMMSDLRDSGAIEQDADVIFGLYREAYYARQETPDDGDPAALMDWERRCASRALDVDILKQRGGETGRITLYCDPATGIIQDMGRDAA